MITDADWEEFAASLRREYDQLTDAMAATLPADHAYCAVCLGVMTIPESIARGAHEKCAQRATDIAWSDPDQHEALGGSS